MMDYSELVKQLRDSEEWATKDGGIPVGLIYRLSQAADAIEELLHAAKKMHTWIFLHSYDEQGAYDECGLSDEMNAALWYGGQFEIKVNDDV